MPPRLMLQTRQTDHEERPAELSLVTYCRYIVASTTRGCVMAYRKTASRLVLGRDGK